MKFMTKRGVEMSMTERILYWIGIVVLLVALYGMNNQISQLEKMATTQPATHQGGNQ